MVVQGKDECSVWHRLQKLTCLFCNADVYRKGQHLGKVQIHDSPSKRTLVSHVDVC